LLIIAPSAAPLPLVGLTSIPESRVERTTYSYCCGVMDSSQLYHQWFGIPPKDQPPNAYRLLGVELFEPDPLVIEAAAEQRMLLLKTRQYGPHAVQSQRLMNEVSHALRTLLCDTERAKYDANLRFNIGRQSVSDWEEPLPSEEIADDEIEEIQPATATPTPLAIRTEAPSHRPRKRQTVNPVLLWAGLGSAALVGLIVLVVLLSSKGSAPTQTVERPVEKPPHTTRRPATTTQRALPVANAEQPSPDDFEFRPSEAPAAPEEQVTGIGELPVTESEPPATVPDPAPEVPPENQIAESPVASEPAPEEPISATPAGSRGEKRPLGPEDFRFLGAFKLPQKACGQSTGYAAGCLALRIVNKRPRLFSDSHIGTGGAVYEVDVPALAKKEPYPTATIVREWGDIYQGHKRKANGESYPLDGEVPTTGLRWDEAEQRLWWVYAQKYNTENQDAPTFGATRFKGDQLTPEGPWKLDVAQSWQRGGTLDIPAWFADKYTGGKRLGVGFGGYYSIFEGGSYGPTLSAAAQPTEGKSPDFITLLAYPIKHECVRDANYQHTAESWMGRNPVNGRGTWNATDEIGGEVSSGGAVWIDAADKHGLLFFASLGTGRLAYEDGGVQAAGRENALFVYDPADLAKVAQKKGDHWTPTPKFHAWKNPAPAMAGRVAGVAYDAASRKLYVTFINAYIEGEEGYPLVVVYQI
jgi:hypothetical protein